MTILFLSTVVLTGPAWCSHLCYFGALDNLAAKSRSGKGPVRNKWALKTTGIILVVLAAIVFRIAGIPVPVATLFAGAFGVLGLGIILGISSRQGRMVHCTVYCPIGTVVNALRFVNPFRLRIDTNSCTDCLACTRSCNYDALNPSDIKARKAGLTCTLCGDCLSSCHTDSLHYRFLNLSPGAARNLYLVLTVSLHAATLALARI
jgi:polyferredoxin